MAIDGVLLGAILLGVGLSIGVISGFFGVGGAFILVPTLNILGLPIPKAIATSLAFTVGVSSVGGYKHYRAGNIFFPVLAGVAIFSFVGITAAKPLLLHLERINLAEKYVQYTFIALLLVFSIGMYLEQRGCRFFKAGARADSGGNRIAPGEKGAAMNNAARTGLKIILIGLFVGMMKGFLGIGGGFILLPLFVILLRMEAKKAVGTSIVVLFISSVYATILYFIAGEVKIIIALILIGGSFAGVHYGVKAVEHIDERTLKLLYSYFLSLAALSIILKQLQLDLISVIYTLLLISSTSIYIVYRYYFRPDPKTGDRRVV